MSEAVEKVRIFEDAKGEHRFTAIAGNGEPVATSEGYTTQASAVEEARKLFPDAWIELEQ